MRPLEDEKDVDRRTFLGSAAMAGVAVILAACGGGGGNSPPTGPSGGTNTGTGAGGTGTGGTGTGGTGTTSLTVRLADFPALLLVGGVANVGTLGATPVAVVRNGTASFLALSRICTHQGCQIDIGGPGFNCPCHGSQFDKDGKNVAGPAPSPLARLAATLSPDGAQLTIA